ncbi:hypothetical protein J4E89_011114 [Alternaria sp. Ai002NY15]|nr:hypothetical protein J4E89_011114 [Alternaria sp. Ai002NY15]
MPWPVSEIPNACTEQAAIVEKTTLDKENEVKVARLKRRIKDILNELPRERRANSGQEYEFWIVKNGGQKIAEIRLAGARRPIKEGTAARDVVTAYEKLLEKVEAEKSSEQ